MKESTEKIYSIAIASDHAGFELKQILLQHLISSHYKIYNLGTDSLESVDYPDYAKKVTTSIVEEMAEYGILICDTGIGMSIAANRHSEIRAALCLNVFMAQRARMHNDANILILGAKLVKPDEAIAILDEFLKAKFEGGRHWRRLNKINDFV